MDVLNWKTFLIGVSSGLAGGLLASYLVTKDQPKKISPEKILQQVKAAFKENGPISGSWIHMKAEPYEKNHLSYVVYKGGISKMNQDGPTQYEFIADATTGTILSIKAI
ncbi:PepSY domain-containing protein [Bacillus marasmi]|uniref:PepSY domain-containing protein n=1 Tax=Bacillus marasmi TaxID=1926279 RepID=UPI00319DE989